MNEDYENSMNEAANKKPDDLDVNYNALTITSESGEALFAEAERVHRDEIAKQAVNDVRLVQLNIGLSADDVKEAQRRHQVWLDRAKAIKAGAVKWDYKYAKLVYNDKALNKENAGC